jgi:hypothetical protein
MHQKISPQAESCITGISRGQGGNIVIIIKGTCIWQRYFSMRKRAKLGNNEVDMMLIDVEKRNQGRMLGIGIGMIRMVIWLVEIATLD